MAFKGSRKGQQAAEPEPDVEMEAGAETGENTSTDAEMFPEAVAVETAARRRGRKPGQTATRGPQLEWTYEREAALARVLKAPKALGDIRTARSVADVLAQDPVFEGEPLLTPEAVKAWVDLVKKRYADQGREHPAYLNFDRLRRRVPTMSLFDMEETEDESQAQDDELEAEAAE